MTVRSLAIDMGSSSLRGIVGEWNPHTGTLTRTEVYRYHHTAEEHDGVLQWGVDKLREAAHEAVEAAGSVDSIAVDGWGVDYLMVDDHNQPLGSAVCYRDPRGAQGRALLADKLSEFQQYQLTGVLPQDINSVYRLAVDPPQEGTLMFLADFLARDLTADPAAVQPWASLGVASTSGLVDAAHNSWSSPMLTAAGVDPQRLPTLHPELQVIGHAASGAAIVAAGSHDTACSLYCLAPEFGNPADVMFISCGSWSVAGTTTARPLTDDAAWRADITNEAENHGLTRVELNLTGLWIEQECRRAWGNPSYEELSVSPEQTVTPAAWRCSSRGSAKENAKRLTEPSSEGLLRLAPDGGAESGLAPDSLIDVCDSRFSEPGQMPQRIVAAASERGITLESREEILSYALDSLAYTQAEAIRSLRKLSGNSGSLIITGGGTRNQYLMQQTANELGETIQCGDPESTALGNLLAQLVTLGVPAEALKQWAQRSNIYHSIQPLTRK